MTPFSAPASWVRDSWPPGEHPAPACVSGPYRTLYAGWDIETAREVLAWERERGRVAWLSVGRGVDRALMPA